MPVGTNARGIFNGDWAKLTGNGTAASPLKYDGKNFTGSVRWTTGPANYVNGIKVATTQDATMTPDDSPITGPLPEPVIEDVPVTSADTTSADTTNADTTNADTTGKPRLTEAQAEALGKAFGFMKAFLNEYKNDLKLQEAWAYLLEGDETAAKLAYWDSEYYKNTLSISDSRIKRKLNQYGVYVKERDAWVEQEIRRLTIAGIKLDPNSEDVKRLLEEAYLAGDNTNQIDAKALAFNQGKIIGGQVGASMSEIRSYARAFGMKYSDSDYKRWSEDVFSGRTTAFDIQAKIRQDSASMFPAYADAILEGESIDSIGSSYKSSYATIMEMDPDAVDWTNPTLKKALQYTVDGKPAIMPNWMFEQSLKMDPAWQFTNNARDSVYKAIYQVKYDMGLI